MPVRIIYGLESIQVEYQQLEYVSVSGGSLNLFFELLMQAAGIREAGHRVRQGVVFRLRMLQGFADSIRSDPRHGFEKAKVFVLILGKLARI
jgi:hypothetical protein